MSYDYPEYFLDIPDLDNVSFSSCVAVTAVVWGDAAAWEASSCLARPGTEFAWPSSSGGSSTPRDRNEWENLFNLIYTAPGSIIVLVFLLFLLHPNIFYTFIFLLHQINSVLNVYEPKHKFKIHNCINLKPQRKPSGKPALPAWKQHPCHMLRAWMGTRKARHRRTVPLFLNYLITVQVSREAVAILASIP